MTNLFTKITHLAMLVIALSVLSACANRPPESQAPPAVQTNVRPLDYSGSWERNYSRGGDIQENVTRLVRKMNRSLQSNSAANRNSGFTSSSPSLGPIISMARLADTITQSDTLFIEQDKEQIRVDREEDFALTCEFNDSTSQRIASALGTEICGWDDNKMVFHASLPDGLTITHRLTLSPDGQELNIATTLTSPATRAPYTLNRFYTRYEPLPSKYECKETLTHKKVCWLRGESN